MGRSHPRPIARRSKPLWFRSASRSPKPSALWWRSSMAHEIRVPRLGWSMEEGTFIRWLKANGDMVRAGEPLFELEGEKALQEIEAVDSGILRINSASPVEGAVVAVGELLGHLAAAGE